jgi:hypothetical protein
LSKRRRPTRRKRSRPQVGYPSSAERERIIRQRDALIKELASAFAPDRRQERDRRWVRVDVTLHATLPADAPLPMPDADVWRHWMVSVMHEMDRLESPNLPEARWERGEVPLFWQGHPVARLQCRPDGRLYLTGVELPAWQGIELPRQWDDPERPQDEGTEVQLTSFCE